MANHLAGESSPYLLQHKDNPVAWYPWGNEALRRADDEDKPVFLSIGYAACHWCHVMERESFENPKLAEILNAHFISIKVDREERPDLDTIYMEAVIAMTGHGGWPMSVWLTPQGIPFFGGTYFPPGRRGQHPGFGEILLSIAKTWNERRPELLSGGDALISRIAAKSSTVANESAIPITGDKLDEASSGLWQVFDHRHGGWGTAPKFPQPNVLEFLLQQYYRCKDYKALEMVEKTLQSMARGGIYDQLAGGFHRYSVDAHWLVPHFEKMLYDNSQLAQVYLHAYQITGKQFYRNITIETLDYVIREMTHDQGGFFSTQDADSEGQEGLYFVWTADEFRATAQQHAELIMDAFGVRENGNFEGANVLSINLSEEDLSTRFGLPKADVTKVLAEARTAFLAKREERVRPGLDDKIITAWNGLMMATFAEAARVLDRSDYRKTAVDNAEFMLETMCTSDGRLLRTWRAGSAAKLNGYLSDYACMAEGLLQVYETTFEPQWYFAAHELAEKMLMYFTDKNGKGFFDTSTDHERLVVRPKTLQDNATPSGNAMAACVLLKLGAYSGERKFTNAAESALINTQNLAVRYPTGFGKWLQALSFAVSPTNQIAVIGSRAANNTHELLKTIRQPYRPHQVVAYSDSQKDGTLIPLLSGRSSQDGKSTAYVCRDFKCHLPVTDAASLKRQLD